MKKIIPISKPVFVSLVVSVLVLTSFHAVDSFEDVSFIQEINSGYEQPVDVVVSQDGTIFVLDSRLSQVLVYDETGYYVKSFGTRGSDPGQMSRPQSIALSPKNEILIADTGNNRVQAFSSEGEFLFSFGSYGTARGQFMQPTGVAVDNNGFILVADSRNNRVQVFSPKGIYRYLIPFNDSPTDVAVDRKDVYYMLRPDAGIVSAIDINADTKTDIPCVIGKKNYIKTGSGLTVDADSNVYITETSENSIKKFNEKEGLLLSFGSEGKSRGQFRSPGGIFVDHDNKIYAVDTKNKRLQILKNTKAATALTPVQNTLVPMIDYHDTIAADLYVSDVQVNTAGEILSLSGKNNFFITHGDVNQVVGTTGRGEGQFTSPAAFDYGPDGKIYVADTRNNRVQIFDQEGKFEFTFGERGEKTGQLSSPQGIVVNSSGIIYVADTLNNRIQLFNKDGIFFMSFGSRSVNKKNQVPANGTFLLPTALALNSREQLFVLDSGNNRLQVFDEKGNHISSIGKFGDKYQQMDNPVDIAIDDEDYIYIADEGNHRIQIIPPPDKSLAMPIVFGSSGLGHGHFQTLTGVAVYGNKIYVSDQNNPGIRVYQFDKNFQKVEAPEPIVEIQKPEEETQDDEDEFMLR